MRIVCVDDEEIILNFVVYLCRQLPKIDEVKGFTEAAEALKYIEENKTDLAILDIDMPVINGINLAVKIKQCSPETAIIFLTGYSQYAVEAFKLHAQGYILKPVNKEKLAAEVDYALSVKPQKQYPHLFARTFGEFDFLIDSKPISFSRSKAKELLALLVEKRGAGITRAAAFSMIYEDVAYDRMRQKQFDVIIRSLKKTLENNGIGEMLDIKSGELRLNTNMFDCDLYRLLDGDTETINSFNGEYMNAYSWASLTEAQITQRVNK